MEIKERLGTVEKKEKETGVERAFLTWGNRLPKILCDVAWGRRDKLEELERKTVGAEREEEGAILQSNVYLKSGRNTSREQTAKKGVERLKWLRKGEGGSGGGGKSGGGSRR